MVILRPSQEDSGQGDVLKLAQVAQVVRNGETLLTRPAECFTQLPLRDQQSRHKRRYRPHIWEEISHIQVFCLVEQVKSTVQVSSGLPYASQNNVPTRSIRWKTGEFAQFLAFQQVLHGSIQIVLLTMEFAHAHIQISRSPQDRLVRHRELQSTLVGTHGFAETTLCKPD